jgi:hypothetical protein
LREDILKELTALPQPVAVELVGYWQGIKRTDTDTFRELIQIVREVTQQRIVGGDLGIITAPEVVQELRKAGLAYVHNNLETTRRLYEPRIGVSEKRLDLKMQTLDLADRNGIPTTSGILIGVGETGSDLAEMGITLRNLPIQRVAVNFMDYETNPALAERYADVKNQLSPSYALKVLTFLRLGLRSDQSLMVGSGVGKYLYNSGLLPGVLRIVDTLHLGSFINLGRSGEYDLLRELSNLDYRIAPPVKIPQGELSTPMALAYHSL